MGLRHALQQVGRQGGREAGSGTGKKCPHNSDSGYVAVDTADTWFATRLGPRKVGGWYGRSPSDASGTHLQMGLTQDGLPTKPKWA